MNCQHFISLIVEAARGQMSNAAARDGAIRHADICTACASRLAQEQSLTAAFRTVALSQRDVSAPARVEANLLAAFQESLGSSSVTKGNTSPASLQTRVARLAPTAAVSNLHWRRFARVTTALAASLVLVVLAALYKEFTQTMPTQPQAITIANDNSRDSKDAAPVDALNNPTPALAATGRSAQLGQRETVNIKGHVESARAPMKIARGMTPRILNSRQVIDGGNAIIEASESDAALNNTLQTNEAERVTEFISLTAGVPPATPLEGGQLVRVQLPRAALASLGLPLNIERENEPVKADVLLGNDGLAHAIRFVR
jgi:hypothetical protein